jgi:hypothetical protein
MTFDEIVILAREVKANKTRSHVEAASVLADYILTRVTKEHELTNALIGEIDLMLAGGEEMIRSAEQCTECGHGGEGPVKDVLKALRPMVRDA